MGILVNKVSTPIRDRTVRYKADGSQTVNLLLKYTGTSGDSIDGNVKVYVNTRNRCTFYGDTKNFEIRVYTSEANGEVKLYDRFAVQANQPPEINDIQVENVSVSEGTMKSKIPSGMLERIENGYYAPFMKNGLTYDYDLSDTDAIYIKGLVDGDDLRGNSMRLDLDYEGANDEVKVFKVVIGSELSQI